MYTDNLQSKPLSLPHFLPVWGDKVLVGLGKTPESHHFGGHSVAVASFQI